MAFQKLLHIRLGEKLIEEEIKNIEWELAAKMSSDTVK